MPGRHGSVCSTWWRGGRLSACQLLSASCCCCRAFQLLCGVLQACKQACTQARASCARAGLLPKVQPGHRIGIRQLHRHHCRQTFASMGQATADLTRTSQKRQMPASLYLKVDLSERLVHHTSPFSCFLRLFHDCLLAFALSSGPPSTPSTSKQVNNIFSRKSSQGIVTGPRSCTFCSRTFVSQHALDIHLSRNMVSPSFQRSL